MTVLTSAPPAAAAPVAWHRMAWVAWRRYRGTLLGLAVLLGALAAYLVVDGSRVRTAYDKVAECRPPASSPECQFRWAEFANSFGDTGVIGAILVLLPGIVGAFVGASLLGRELETGVFRYSWTQGVGRMRWAVALIAPAAVGVALVMGGLGVLVSWRDQPMLDSGMRHRLDPSLFPTTGVAVAAWARAAFSGGVLAGLLWRRVIPAIATTFALWFGLAYLASELRLRWPAPLTTSDELVLGDLDIDQWWTKGGARVSSTEINSLLEDVGAQMNDGDLHVQVDRGATQVDPLEYLRDHGYTLMQSYQPDSRYWTFQWMEAGVLVVVSVALLGVALWLLRRLSV
jgi:hypothetical protein